jgi:hypothetical protein
MNTWGSIYRKALARGYDHGYAAHLANTWERKRGIGNCPHPTVTE